MKALNLTGQNTEENLKKVQKNDRIKNEWSQNHNIPLIRIPYIEYEQLNDGFLLSKIKEVLF